MQAIFMSGLKHFWKGDSGKVSEAVSSDEISCYKNIVAALLQQTKSRTSFEDPDAFSHRFILISFIRSATGTLTTDFRDFSCKALVNALPVQHVSVTNIKPYTVDITSYMHGNELIQAIFLIGEAKLKNQLTKISSLSKGNKLPIVSEVAIPLSVECFQEAFRSTIPYIEDDVDDPQFVESEGRLAGQCEEERIKAIVERAITDINNRLSEA